MRFRCPNCNSPVEIGLGANAVDDTSDVLTCPSCQSKFSLSGDGRPTEIPDAGLTIAHFEVLQILGEGAFGSVFKAWDPQLERHVAVKVLREGRETKDSAKQMLREARVAAGIKHPNIVQVYEVGPYKDAFYIACELVDGISLSEWLKFHSPKQDDTARLVIKICQGMQAAHEAGVIHRDLKPGNILMDHQNEPHVSDFGLAKRANPSEITVTHDGQILGTPSYMSPEQARGEVRGISHLSDVYSIGVILYELLTGQRPFVATDSRTVLYRILTEDAKSPRSLNPAVSRDLERICLQAMEKDPSRRYQSAADLAADLERCLQGFPVRARRYGVLRKFSKLVLRNRVVSGAIAAVLIAGIVVVWQYLQPLDGAVQVVITTDPVADRVVFTPYDEYLRVPHQTGQVVESKPSAITWLQPGMYRVQAFDADGRFHEVWRQVPAEHLGSAEDQLYPHDTWIVTGNGIVELPSFRIFRDEEVIVKTAEVKGGTFMMGFEDRTRFSATHRHLVPDMQVGINEVSYGEFRSVLGGSHYPTSSETWLSRIDGIFGDRSDVSPEMPVTGYPRDVAILFCELAGGRLPNNAEWEYVASQSGETVYSTGDHPPEVELTDWNVIATTAESPDDSHPQGIRNLCFSAAEFTDSANTSYRWLYPAETNVEPKNDSPTKLSTLSQIQEVRGGDADWVQGGPAAGVPAAKTRVSINKVWGTDATSRTNRGRIGWRLIRMKRTD